MGKRQPTRQQRRVCPTERQRTLESGSRRGRRPAGAPAGKEGKRPGQRKTRTGLPELSAETDPGSLFGRAGRQARERFAELLAQSELDGELASLLREKEATDQGAGPPSPPTGRPRPAPPEAELDLHGCTVAEAEARIASFLLSAARQGQRTVRIITGKGLHSEGEAVLRELTEEALTAGRQRGSVRSWRWEQGEKRKSGAVLVVLP